MTLHSVVAARWCWLALLLLAGCTRQAQVVLTQPFAPPSQRTIELAGDEAYYDQGADGSRILMGFRLPSSKDGPRAFAVFLMVPDEPGSYSLGPTSEGRGFLVQELGSLAGKATFVRGECRLSGGRRFRKLTLSATCDDGARITGEARLEQTGPEIRRFERSYAADVASLRADTSSEPGGEDADADAVRRAPMRPRPHVSQDDADGL